MDIANLTIKVSTQSLKTAGTALDKFSRTGKKTFDVVRRSVFSLQGALAGLGVGLSVKSVVDASIRFDQLSNKMLAAAKDANVAADSMKFVRDLSQDLGLELTSTADGFAGFSAAALRSGLTLDQTKGIFEDMAKASTSLQLSGAQVGLIFRALEQIASKGVVQMEELKLQLGDQLPGALEIAAKAMGVTSSELIKMIENGEVAAVDFLPKFAKAIKDELGGSALEASTQLRAETNRLTNSIFDLKNEFSDTKFIEAYTDIIRDLADYFTDPKFIQGVKDFGNSIGQFIEDARTGLEAVSNLTSAIIRLVNKLPGLGFVATTVANAFGQLDELINGVADSINRYSDSLEGFSRVEWGPSSGSQAGLAAFQFQLQDLMNDLSKAENMFVSGVSGDFTLKDAETPDFINGIPIPKPKPKFEDERFLKMNERLAKEREKAVESAQKQVDVTQEVIDSLGFEIQQLGRTNLEQETYNNLRRAGVALDSEAGRKIADLTQQFQKQSEALGNQKRIAGALTDSFESFFSSAIRGTQSFGDSLAELGFQIADLIAQITIFEPLKQSLSSSFGGSGFLGNVFGGLFGGGAEASIAAASARGAANPALFGPGFATGGSFTVGGSGGPDSQLVPLRLTPGEIVNVKKGGQQEQRAPNIIINNNAPQAQVSAGVGANGFDINVVIDDAFASNASRRGTKTFNALNSLGTPLSRG